jgi:8-oxo-dGTP pyrophosphatase MutT (NUDIX family)
MKQLLASSIHNIILIRTTVAEDPSPIDLLHLSIHVHDHDMLPRTIIPLIPRTSCIEQPSLPRMIHIGSAAVNSLLLAFVATSKNNNISNSYNYFSTFRKELPTSPTLIANKMTMTDDERTAVEINERVIDKLRSVGMEKKELKRHTKLRRASILIPLFERNHSPRNNNQDTSDNNNDASSNIHVLFTQRVSNMTSHGGEVCFPGGMQDMEDDNDDVQTALREASEEVGLQHQYIECIARMESVESKHSLCVTPIIGRIHPPSYAEPSQLQLNAEEVEVAFAVPLHYFAVSTNCHSVDKYKWKGGNVEIRTYLYDDPESGRQFKIWGLTAHVVHLVAMLAFGEGKIKT